METNRRIGPCFDTTKSRSSNKIDFRLGMLNVIDSLMKNENSWLFNKPVDPKADGCPNYFNIIKHPMDFGTIRNNIINHKYKSEQEIVDDINLVFQNCLTFNSGSGGRSIRKIAMLMKERFQKEYNNYLALYPKYNHDIWIQCDRCLKWRELDSLINLDGTKRWNCEMTEDPKRKHNCMEEEDPIIIQTIKENNHHISEKELELIRGIVLYVPLQHPIEELDKTRFGMYYDRIYSQLHVSSTNRFIKIKDTTIPLYSIYFYFHTHKDAIERPSVWKDLFDYLRPLFPATLSQLSSEPYEPLLKEKTEQFIFPYLSAYEDATNVFLTNSISEQNCCYCHQKVSSSKIACRCCSAVCCSSCIPTNYQSIQSKPFHNEWLCPNCEVTYKGTWNNYPLCLYCGESIELKSLSTVPLKSPLPNSNNEGKEDEELNETASQPLFGDQSNYQICKDCSGIYHKKCIQQYDASMQSNTYICKSCQINKTKCSKQACYENRKNRYLHSFTELN